MHTVNKLWILLLFGFIWGSDSGWADGRYRIQTRTVSVQNQAVKQIVASARFQQGPERVWQLINDWKSFPSFIPRCEAVEVIESDPAQDRIYLRMGLPPAIPDLWNILEVRKLEDEARLEWKMLSGNMNKNSGKVRIQAEGTGSILSMEVDADPGFFLPGWLVTWGTKNFLPKVLKAMGDRLNEWEVNPPNPSTQAPSS